MINFKPTHLPFDGRQALRRARYFALRSIRLMRAIVRRGAIEPVMVFLITTLFISGVTLMAAHATPVLGFPKLFGFAYVALATLGTVGLFGREPRIKAAFGFIGLFLRLWMSARFLLTDWQSPQWVTFAVGAAAFGWIGARSACRYVWVKTKARQQAEPIRSSA